MDMKTQLDINELLNRGNISNELEYERALNADNSLRKLSKEDQKFKNLAILNLPYLENDDFLNKELNEFLLRLGYAYLAMILAAIVFAYFISKYITKSLKTISDKMNETRLEKRNKKILNKKIMRKCEANFRKFEVVSKVS